MQKITDLITFSLNARYPSNSFGQGSQYSVEEEAESAGARADGKHQGIKALTTQHFQYTMELSMYRDYIGKSHMGYLELRETEYVPMPNLEVRLN